MSDVTRLSENEDTLPKVLLRNAQVRPDKPAYREKDYGIWQTYTWAETAEEVKALSLGFKSLGLERGDKVAIIGDNRPHLYWVFLAVEALGGVAVPLFQDSAADDMKYVLEHAGVKYAVAENQEQVDKLFECREAVPSLSKIVYYFTRGMRHYSDPDLHSYADVQAMGRELASKQPGLYEEEIAKGSADDISLMAYTSGTTGNPKGVIHTHRNILVSCQQIIEVEGLGESEDTLNYLPMAWVGDHFYFAQGLVAGFRVNCPESGETVMGDLRELGPTYYFAPPVTFETMLTDVQIRMEDAGAVKRGLFNYFMGVAKKVGVDLLEGRPVGLVDRIKYFLGDILVYGPMKDNLGLTRVRKAYTGGAPMGPDTFNFYRSIGFNLKQLYGQTETCAYACIQRDGDVRSDTVGTPAPGCEIKISDDGEVLIKSPGMFVEYYKNEEATTEARQDGWYHTGDAGIWTDEKHLKIIDRAKDVGRLTNGDLFAPQFVENKLKFFQYVREVVSIGIGKDNVTAFINIDLGAVGNWAERNGLSYTSYTDLANRDEVYELIAGCVEQVNADLARDSELSSSQIKRFLLLHKELDADDGELTRTGKVRRRLVADRYQPLIDGLYGTDDVVTVETEFVLEDGRRNKLEATLKIRDAKTFEPVGKAA